ncbi:MAG: VWA domain-containing protein, partial [Pseudomonadota bacterium]
MIRLAEPSFLFLLLLLIPAYFWGWKTGGRIRFSTLKVFKGIARSSHQMPRKFMIFLRLLAILFLVLALARPQSGKHFSEISSEGIDMMLILDTSGSMQALDFERKGERVNRLEVVKDVVADFIKSRPSDKLGLIVFAGEAFTQCPLTLDHGILMDFLAKVHIGIAGDSTAIGQAIGVGVNRMKDIPAKSKVMILLTDGAN